MGGYVIWAEQKWKTGTIHLLKGPPDDVSFAALPPNILKFFHNAKNRLKQRAYSFRRKEKQTLFDVSVRQVHAGVPHDAIKWNAVKLNSKFEPPLEDEEVEKP